MAAIRGRLSDRVRYTLSWNEDARRLVGVEDEDAKYLWKQANCSDCWEIGEHRTNWI